jgi:hypothetical protein
MCKSKPFLYIAKNDKRSVRTVSIVVISNRIDEFLLLVPRIVTGSFPYQSPDVRSLPKALKKFAVEH